MILWIKKRAIQERMALIVKRVTIGFEYFIIIFMRFHTDFQDIGVRKD